MFPNIPNSFYDANTNIRGSSQLLFSLTVDFNTNQHNSLGTRCVLLSEESAGAEFRTNKGWRANCGVSSVQNMRAVIF